MYHHAAQDIIAALSAKPGLLPQTKPEFLRDVLSMKRARGDADAEAFKATATIFSSGLYATIPGAARAMRQWTSKPKGVSEVLQARRLAFLADLDRVLAGDLTGWRAAS